MIEKDDWRLRDDVEYLKNKEINPTDGEEITQYVKHLKKCIFGWKELDGYDIDWSQEV